MEPGAKRRLHFADQESDSDIVHHEAGAGSWFRIDEGMPGERCGFRARVP